MKCILLKISDFASGSDVEDTNNFNKQLGDVIQTITVSLFRNFCLQNHEYVIYCTKTPIYLKVRKSPLNFFLYFTGW